MKRALVIALALVAALAIVYALRPAARRGSSSREDVTRPHAEIDDASRAQLEQALREAAREDASPKKDAR